MTPEVDEKANYQNLHSRNAFREPRLYPRNWDMTAVPQSKNGHSYHIMENKSENFEAEQANFPTKDEVAFDEWQLNRQFTTGSDENSGYFAAF
ncbi:MAG: hypothetical protein ACPL4H_10765 [Anaerolineales bacterium]